MRFTSGGGELVGEFVDVGLLGCMFDGHADDVALVVDLDENVFVDVVGFGNVVLAEFQQERIGVGEVFGLHEFTPEIGGLGGRGRAGSTGELHRLSVV